MLYYTIGLTIAALVLLIMQLGHEDNIRKRSRLITAVLMIPTLLAVMYLKESGLRSRQQYLVECSRSYARRWYAHC